jgi:hypothetical protein
MAQAEGTLARLAAQCAERAPLFAPEAERCALTDLLNELMHSARHGSPAGA